MRCLCGKEASHRENGTPVFSVEGWVEHCTGFSFDDDMGDDEVNATCMEHVRVEGRPGSVGSVKFSEQVGAHRRTGAAAVHTTLGCTAESLGSVGSVTFSKQGVCQAGSQSVPCTRA